MNGHGKTTSQVSPDTGTTTFTFDSASNLKTRLDARGVQASDDALNRLTQIVYPGGTVTDPWDSSPIESKPRTAQTRGLRGGAASPTLSLRHRELELRALARAAASEASRSSRQARVTGPCACGLGIISG